MRERLDVMEQVVTCEECDLHTQCTAPVFMSGRTPAQITIIGEAPGEQEDIRGEPFVGPSGELLREALTVAGFNVDNVAFVNSVSCYPHGTPNWDQMAACSKNLADQLDLAGSKWLLAVGQVALKAFLPHVAIKHGRGRPISLSSRKATLYATYHPAAALRNSNFEAAMIDDLALFKTIVDADDPFAFIPDQCAGCTSIEVCWYEENGLGWCVDHIPDHEQSAYAERMALVAAR